MRNIEFGGVVAMAEVSAETLAEELAVMTVFAEFVGGQ